MARNVSAPRRASRPCNSRRAPSRARCSARWRPSPSVAPVMRIVLTIPRRFSHRLARADAAEREAFADVSRALVEVAVDRAQLAGAVEPRDRRAVGTQDL